MSKDNTDFIQSEEKEKKFIQTKEKKYKQSGEVMLTFKQNRAFELHIGRQLYRFLGRESKKLPISILDHPDFTDRLKQKFVIKEC